jgi:fibronectin-binding autotransporter adhesin
MKSRITFMLATGLGLALFSTTPSRGDAVWQGGGPDQNWSSPENWVGGVAPANPQPVTVPGTNGVIIFNSNPPVLDSVVDGPWTIGRLAFGPASGAFTLTGKTLVLSQSHTNPATANTLVLNQGPNTITINNRMEFSSTQLRRTLQIDSSGGLVFNGSLTKTDTVNPAELWLRGGGAGLGILNAPINFGTNALFKTDNSTWVLNSAGHTVGYLRLAVGTIRLGVADALPATAYIDLVQNATATLDLNNNDQTLAFIRVSNTNPTNTVYTIATGTGAGGTLTLNDNNTTNTLWFTTITGNGRLVKNGNGLLVLSGANTYSGGTLIAAGRLQIGTNSGNGSIVGPVTNNASLIINRTGTLTLDSSIVGTGTLTKQGAGNLVLRGANTYSGATTVSGGTLTVNGTNDGAGAVTLASGTALAGNGVLAGAVTLTGARLSPGDPNLAGTLSFSNNLTLAAGSTATFELAGATTVGGGVNDLVVVRGDLSLSNNVITVLPLTPLVAGTYRLFNYLGNKTGSLNPTVVHSTRYTMTVDESVPGQINLVVSGANADLTWNSPASQAWDVNTSLNWLNLGTAQPSVFQQGDAVLFNDVAGLQPAVTVGVTVYPGSLTVKDGALAYTLSGGGRISGNTGITKQGTNVLTVSTANDFNGPVSVQEGTLRAGNAAALGSTIGGTVVASGARLDVNGQNLGAESVTVSGHGLANGGALFNSAGAQNNALRFVTLAGDTTFGGTGRWDIRSDNPATTPAALSANGYNLTKVGPSETWLVNVGQTGLGQIDIVQGLLGLQGATVLGDPAQAVTVRTNAGFGFWALNNNVLNKPVVMEQAFWRNDNGNNTNAGAVSLTGSNFFTMSANLTLSGAVSGPGSLHKAGAGLLTLSGVNSYQGDTLVSGGRLKLTRPDALAGTAGVELRGGTVLDVSEVSGGLTLGGAQKLLGTGSVTGNVADSPGASIVPAGASGLGTLVFSNHLTLGGGGTLRYDLAGVTTEGGGVNDLLNVRSNLTLSGVTTVHVTPVAPLDSLNPYTLFSYGGALAGDAANFTVTSDSRYSFTADTATTPGKVKLSVTGGAAANLLWVGGAAGGETLWDIRTTRNWDPQPPTGSRDVFYPGDSVTFGDFPDSYDVTLVGALSPAAINVSAQSGEYKFLGAGKLSGALGGLHKSGASVLTLANTGVNDYLGGTTISEGALRVGNGGAGGNLGPGAITNNATLLFNRSDDVTVANVIRGSGAIEKQGPNALTLSGANGGFNGPITVSAGILRVGHTNALGTNTVGTTVTDGGTLDVAGLILNGANEAVVAAGAGANGVGAFINTMGGAATALETIKSFTMTGDTTIGGSGRWDLTGTWTGNGYSLTKVGLNEIWLSPTAGDMGLGDLHIRQGLLGIEGVSVNVLGDPLKTLTIYSNAVLGFWALNNTNTPFNKIVVMNNGLWRNGNGNSYFIGPVTLNQSNTFDIAANLFLQGKVSGDGLLAKIGAGTLVLQTENDYAGGTVVSAGTLQIGALTASGSVTGPIVNNATVLFRRSDAYVVPNRITGGTVVHEAGSGPLTLPGVNTVASIVARGHSDGSPLILPAGSATTLTGTLVVGQNAGVGVSVARIEPGAFVWVANISVGDSPNTATGMVHQAGGTVVVSNLCRVGHWPTSISSYVLGGGALTLVGTPTNVVNQSGVGEQPGVLYLGVDGTGVFTQTGGVASAHGLVLDARGNTAGTDTFNLEGGRFTIGPSGIKSGSLDANATYQINLGGGTLAASVNWTSSLAMTLTGVNGDTAFDIAGSTNFLNGVLAGPGGLVKQGPGALVLGAANTYAGATRVDGGALVLNGAIGAAPVTVTAGALAGTGTVGGPVAVEANGTLAPGLTIGTLTVNGALTLAGRAVMQVNKSGATLTSDLVQGVTTLTLGGNLSVLVSGDALAIGDTFNLFDAASFAGAFHSFTLALPGPGLAWDTSKLAVDGTISVISAAPPTLTIQHGAGFIELTWPPSAAGFSLQSQTNALGAGLTDNWVELLGVSGNRLLISPIPTNENVFFRLVMP